MATFSSGVKCFRSFLIRSLRYLNGGTRSPFPTEAGHDQHPSRHQILAFFCAAIGSLRPLAHDEGLDLFPGGAAAERFPQIRSVLRIKTQVPDPVCGQATTV